tara:strand:+ start:9564 stop:10523 length:960 start_codon:yes stop_codon:yes gene_type:complete
MANGFGLKSLLGKIIEKGKLVLVQPTLLFANISGLKDYEYVVPIDYIGRIDLICLEVYGSMEHIDYLLKYNNISNPFSIDYLDILKIPNLGATMKVLERPKDKIDNVVRQEFLDKKKLKPKDQRRSEFLKKKYNIKEVLPPNVLKSGFKTYKFSEKEGVPSTIMGAQAQNPEPNTFSKEKTNKQKDTELDELSLEYKNAIKEGDIELADKLKLIAERLKEKKDKFKLNRKPRMNTTGIDYKGKNKSEADVKKHVRKVYDDAGNYVGTESILESLNVDDDKMTITITTTLVKPDGTVETKQITRYTKPDEFGEIPDIDTN